MTKQEAIKIMALLGSFYGAGKSNPEVMAEGWHIVLEPYDYKHAYNAVLDFAKNDTRDYASFPTVGKIVQGIEKEMAREEAPIKEIVRAISYGWGYDQISADAKANITEEHYNDWLKMDAEKFANNAGALSDSLKKKQKMITGEQK